MERTISVDCPCCGTRLEIELSSGKVERHSKGPKKKESFEDALKRLETEKKDPSEVIAKSNKDIEDKKRKARELFDQGVEKIKKEGLGEKPVRDIDLD